jgi:hypothetical protein
VEGLVCLFDAKANLKGYVLPPNSGLVVPAPAPHLPSDYPTSGWMEGSHQLAPGFVCLFDAKANLKGDILPPNSGLDVPAPAPHLPFDYPTSDWMEGSDQSALGLVSLSAAKANLKGDILPPNSGLDVPAPAPHLPFDYPTSGWMEGSDQLALGLVSISAAKANLKGDILPPNSGLDVPAPAPHLPSDYPTSGWMEGSDQSALGLVSLSAAKANLKGGNLPPNSYLVVPIPAPHLPSVYPASSWMEGSDQSAPGPVSLSAAKANLKGRILPITGLALPAPAPVYLFPLQLILKRVFIPFPPRTQWGYDDNPKPTKPSAVVNATSVPFRRVQPPGLSIPPTFQGPQNTVRVEDMHNFPYGTLAAAAFTEFIGTPVTEIMSLAGHTITKPIYEGHLDHMCRLMGEVAAEARRIEFEQVILLPEMTLEKAEILNELAAAHSVELYSTSRLIPGEVWMEFTGNEPVAKEHWIEMAVLRAWMWTRNV